MSLTRPSDAKGEHSGSAEAVESKAIRLGHGMMARLNPLDKGHRSSNTTDKEWASLLASRCRDLLGPFAEVALERYLSPLEHTAIELALRETARETSVPVLLLVADRILAPGRDTLGDLTADDGRQVGHALRRLVAGDLSGLFDGASTVTSELSLPVVSQDLSRAMESASAISVGQPRPIPGGGERLSDLGDDDLRQRVDGIRTFPSRRRAAARHLRRRLEAAEPTLATSAHGQPLATRP